MTNNELQSTTQNTKDLVKWTPVNLGVYSVL
jgi:hypothetical protein